MDISSRITATAVDTAKRTNWRWVICSLLFFATTINYLDRQVLSLTWKDFIAPEFHWTDSNYGDITGFFSLFYAGVSLFAGKIIDFLGSRKGYLGVYSAWWPAITIGLAGAAHQAWSANLYSTIGDMFPTSTVGSIVGIGTMAGGLSAYIINKGSGILFDYSAALGDSFKFLTFAGKPAGYMIVFSICAIAYLSAWCIMKILVPKYKKIEI